MNVYQMIVAVTDDAGLNAEMVFHYKIDEAITTDPFVVARQLVAAWIAGPLTSLMPLFGIDIDISLLSAKRVTGGGGETFSTVNSSSGGGAATCISMGNCVAIEWVNDDPLNKVGHTFVPGIDSTKANMPDYWFTSFIDGAVQAFAAAMTVPLTLSGGDIATFAIFNKKTGIAWPVIDHMLKYVMTLMNKRIRN